MFTTYYNYLKFLLLLLFIIPNLKTNAQTAPGGVSSNLGLWLKASDFPLNTGSAVILQSTDWVDASPLGNDAECLPNSSSAKYAIAPREMNFNNSIRFNAEWLESPLDIDKNNLNVFMVYKPIALNPNRPLWGNGTNAVLGKQAYVDKVSDGNSTGTGYSPYTTSSTLNQAYLNHINIFQNNTSSVYINGILEHSYNTGITTGPNVHPGVFIGKSEDSQGGDATLSIAEVIVYTDALSTTQREQINSYLAIKHGITLGHDYTINNGTGGNTTVWTTNNTYYQNIVGLARDDNSALNVTKSKSEHDDALITLSTTGTIPNNEALLIGRNNSPTSNSSPFTTSNFFIKGRRLNSVWKCQKTTGFNIPVDIGIDNSISLPMNNGFQSGNLVLLVSNQANMSNNLTAYPLTNNAVSGNYEASNVILGDGQFFTLAYLDVALWVKADAPLNTIASGSPSLYYDNVLGINSMSSTTATTTPSHISGSDPSSINFNPYIKFNDGALDQYIGKSDLTAFGNSGVSTFLVLRRDNIDVTLHETMVSYAISNTQANEIVISNPSNVTVSIDQANLNQGNNNAKDITNSIPHILTNLTGNNADNQIRLDGTGSAAAYKNNNIIPFKGTLILGQDQDNLGGGFVNSQAYEGDIAEAIIFNKKISNGHRNSIETYLAIKYGITLQRDYNLTNNNTILWDRSANITYHNNVAGIGREDQFDLNQATSTSQNGTTVDLVVNHTGSLNTNSSYLIWGCNTGVYDNISPTNAPTGYQISEKIWKVQNLNNLVGSVDVTLKIPPSLNSIATNKLKLMVENSSTFSTAATFYPVSSSIPGFVTFTGIPLQDNEFFSLALEDSQTDVTYNNAINTGASSSFEACIGDLVTFTYSNLASHPNRLQLTDDQGMGMTFNIPLTAGNNITYTTGIGFSGVITLTIPANTGSGNVKLIDTNAPGTGVIYNFNSNLVVHKPLVDFYLPQAPLCATDTIALIGVPTGGTFSAMPSNLIFNNNSLIGINANWSPNINDSIQDITVDYSYTPSYINGQTCANPIVSSKTISIRDNRLNTLEFQYIITNGTTPSINDRVALHIDSPIVQRALPEFRTTRSYPVSFSGNYVNQINNVDSFFADYAGFGTHPVLMQYDNGGCIGELSGDLEVLFPLQLSGLVDTLCNEADTLRLTRDSRPEYAYNIDTISSTSISGTTILQIIESNIIDSVSTLNINHRAAVNTVNATANNEIYTLDPQSPVLVGVNNIVITMHYTASNITTQLINSAGVVVLTRTRIGAPSIIEYPITLIDRPVLSFNLDSVYCKNAAIDSLIPSPIFEPPYSSFSYRYSNAPSGPFSFPNNLPSDKFEASYVYDQAVPLGAQNQDLYVELEYTVDRYGCTDTYLQNTKIIRPIAFSLFLDPPPIITGYCNNATPIKLEPINTITNALGIGEFLVDGVANSPLIDTANYFLPDSAQSLDYDISYQFTDTATSCISTSSVKIISIREPASIQLQIDGNAINPKICGNRDTALLETILLSGSNPSSITYSSTNLTIVGDTLKPYDTYNNVNGNIIQTITVNYRDSFSCATSDDLLVEIYKPSPRMNGFLGAPSSNIYTYCNNKSPFFIIETPSHSTGDIVTGAGVILSNGIYSYDPNSILVDSLFMDTVRYEYTDALGCSAIVESIVQIDSIPDISLNGLDSSYCVNNIPVQLNGIPNSSNGATLYTGAGINQQGIFSPTIAGIGTKTITYFFEDANGCESDITQTTTIHALPIPQFTFPQNQYCTSDTLFALNVNSPIGTYNFWGNIIDSVNILNPQDTTGQQTVFYALTDSLGCIDTSSTTILINPLPIITISGLDTAYCINSSIDNILISPSPTATSGTISGSSPGFSINSAGITFDPNYDTSGIKSFTYTYDDNITDCSNTLVFNTTVYEVPSLNYVGIDSVYCAIDSLYTISGIPSGGVFSGAGISNAGSQYYFNPIFTGGGNRILSYTVDTSILHDSSYLLSCPVTIDIPIVVNQLPNLLFSGPGNSYRFCSNEGDVLLDGLEPTPTLRLFTSTTPGAVNVIIDTSFIPIIPYRIIDTSYFFSPNNAGAGVHNITYSATDSITGCQDTMPLTYYVTDYGTGASFSLDSAYCASSDSIFMIGSPNGGSFLRNQDTLTSSYLTLSTFTTLTDTIIYNVTYDACTASDTQLVTINPLINLSFTGNKPSKTYCLGDDDSPLFPNISGGTFNGNAVISGDSLFSLKYANTGDNIITYSFIDPITYCESTVADTFFVFGMPDVNFQVIGGCQFDSIFFHPDNTILGLNNTFGSRIIDSITDIIWELEPGVFINGNSNSNNEIDSINYIFNAPGIYETKLSVANRTYCIDTTTVRIVISPTIASNQFPYDETFENSNGRWYAEAKDTSNNLLWEWGKDTIPFGINNPNNNIWITQLNGQYTANEAAWVYSPCFDISDLKRPMIRFDNWTDSRDRGDGAVLEFQNPDGTWSPLGELDRGINWFNTEFIAGSPGNQQNQSPIGWSGKNKKWINSRYKLDEFKNTVNSKLRLRMAFGSSPNNLTEFHNGFAFDNVWIGNRTRNVLLETTSNINEPNMDYINNYVYQLVSSSHVNKDVILLQYPSEAPNNADEFYQFAPIISKARALFNSTPISGTALIDGDGINVTKSKWLNDLSFEQDMLESPQFKVEIDTFYHNNPGQFTLTTTVTALVDIPTVKRYRINMLITQDSLVYTSGELVHAVLRKDYKSDNVNTFDKSWVAGVPMTLTHTYPATDLNYVPNRFQAVVFIQEQQTKEVFQAATSRDVNGYWVGVDQIASEKELNEIKDLTLYPNPAQDYIKIDFPELLKKDYNWKLISMAGVTVKEAVIQAGEQSLEINNYDLPSGVYIFMVYNDNVYSQRKVIINQD